MSSPILVFDASLLEEGEYWKRRLSGEAGASNIPLDRDRPERYVEAKDTVGVSLSGAIYQQMVKVTGGAPFLVFTTLMAALKVCLQTYTGHQKIAVGTPALKESSRANALVILTEVDDQLSFKQLLLSERENLLAAYKSQRYPFNYLVRDLGLEESENRCELFDVALEMDELHGALPAVKNDITIAFALERECITGRIKFNETLFERTSIERLKDHYLRLLRAGLESPNSPLCELEMMSEAERNQVLTGWNITAPEPVAYDCVTRMFEAQVERTHDAIAVTDGQQQVSYGQLNVRANKLAHYLQELGVGPEVLVGIYLERSLDMVVALLGVLKAGGAYVPLDSSYPKARLDFMLADAQAHVILTHTQMLEALPEHRFSTLCLDADWAMIDRQHNENPNSHSSGDELAYVIYTSGSTGKPKGAMIHHRGLINYLTWCEKSYMAEGAHGAPVHSPIGFDLTVTSVFSPLMVGKSVELLAEDDGVDALGEALWRGAEFSFMKVTPSHLEFLRNLWPPGGRAGSARSLIIGGEALFRQSIDFWRECAPDTKLINEYGPTETVVGCCVYEVPAGVQTRNAVPIGRPIINTQIYLVDERQRLAPIGVQAELQIGGACLGRGYLNRPELTAERFIPNQFSSEPGGRLYRSGDLARYLSDGNIEFLGRIDHQVKIRGFRIEPGEIEAVLLEHTAVRDAILVVREQAGGDGRLVAYIVANQEQPLNTTELRRFLQQKMPDYMVPSTFVFLDEIPLTPNGKVDLRALPAPDQARPDLEAAYQAPRTVAEETLARIWAEMLGIERVGIHDNFFELGGDSILSIRVIARTNQAGLRLTPKQLFQHQTIAKLASVADAVAPTAVEQASVIGPVPLTPIQHWFFEQHLPDPHHFNQSVLLEAKEKLDPVLMEQVIGHLVSHHDALRLRFIKEDKGWRQLNAAIDGIAPFRVLDLPAKEEHEQVAAIEATAAQLQTTLNLSDGPLMLVALFDLGPSKPDRLLIIIHHLAVDGVSWRILLEDIENSYQQLRLGDSILFPSKTSSFKEWAESLIEYADSEAIEQELSYWLSGLRARVLPLPVDYAGGENTVASVRTVSVSLGADETRALLQDVPRAYNTNIDDALLAALAQASSRWTESPLLLVDRESHGRHEVSEGLDLTRTVGWFTAVSPVLLNVRGVSSPGRVLKQIKEQLREIPRLGIGYGVLRYLEAGEAAEKLRALPQAELLFNYHGQFDQVLSQSALFRPGREYAGRGRNVQAQRNYLLEINGSVIGGELNLSWSYSENIHKRSTVERLAEDFIATLRSFINHSRPLASGRYRPTDFPLAEIDERTLDGLTAANGHIEDIYPLSPLQEGLLFHKAYESESAAYFEHLVWKLEGGLEVAALQRAWAYVVARHPALRTAFIWTSIGKPLQVVSRDATPPWEQLDWRELSGAQQSERLEHLLELDRERGFELSSPPLMRFTLIQIDQESHYFVWSFHHLLLDGWSKTLVLKECAAFYEAITQGRDLRLPQAPRYRDYIAWLKGQDMSKAEEFWRNDLRGFRAPTPLGMDFARDVLADDKEKYREQYVRISSDETAALQSFARHNQLTLSTIVSGAWALLLSRYSGKEDVVFGTVVSGRPADLPGVETVVGLFINTLPVRVRVSPEAGLFEWLKEIQAHQVEARQYEYTPVTEVQKWSEVPRGTPLFESIFVFENFPVEKSSSEVRSSLKASNIPTFDLTNFPFAVVVGPGSELALKIVYDCRRFETAAIKQMLRHFQIMLTEMPANIDDTISSLSIITQEESQQLTSSFNQNLDVY